MIMTIQELKIYITTSQTDEALDLKLRGLTSYIKKKTNNNFSDGFPADIKMGVVELFRWEEQYRDKLGLSSETISRHSVSYNSNIQLEGTYPKELFNFLKPYMKARF